MLSDDAPPRSTAGLPRTGEVVIRTLADVEQKTTGPLIKKVIAAGSVVDTDAYDIYHRLPEWGHTQRTVCHAYPGFFEFVHKVRRGKAPLGAPGRITHETVPPKQRRSQEPDGNNEYCSQQHFSYYD